jgi:signal transduction histidine kinase
MYPVPADEAARLAAIDAYRLQDIRRDAEFEHVARLAANILTTPMAVVSIITEHAQCFAGASGLDGSGTARGDAFCTFTILTDEPLIVEDALLDPRFHKYPAVLGPPHVRFYAGAPIHAGGHRVGALCIIDSKPRQISQTDVKRLQGLARIVDTLLENRLLAQLNARNQQRLADIIESLPVALVIFDQHDRFVRANKVYFDLMFPGPGPMPQQGDLFTDVLDMVEAHGITMAIEGATGTDWKAERLERRLKNAGIYEIRLNDGKTLGCREIRTADGGLVVTFTNITALKEREAVVAIQSKLLRTTLESIDEGIAVFDGRGALIACSDAYFDMLRVPATLRQVGMSIQTLVNDIAQRGYFGPGNPERIAAAVMGQLVPDHSRRNEIVTPEGRTLALTHSVAGDGRVILTCVDVTEKKAVERLKDEFVSTVSHELRTPLTSIKGSLGLLAAGAAGAMSEKALRLIDIARANVERLTRLVNDLLDMDKIATGKMEFKKEQIDLADFVGQCVEQNRPYAERVGIALIARPSAEPLMIWADPTRLGQVAANLISNAVKYSPAGSQVVVSTERHGRHGRFSVIDCGPGIPEQFRHRIFSRFAQADTADARAKQGTGLGLAISRDIVERQGGTIGFVTGPDTGTTFHVDIPLQEVRLAPAPPQAKEAADARA